MRNRNVVGLVAAIAIGALVLTTALQAGDRTEKDPQPRDVTVIGRVVDLQNFMTGKYASSDHAKCTRDCIRAGVPVALQTEEGLIVIGQGEKGPQRIITPFAYQEVELKGKLFQRHGLRYIDVTSANVVEAAEPEEEEELDPWSPEDEEEQEDDY
ncbi:MAG: hypothetical protein JSV78_04810 [Phycisphaerales bacterium]|nr:MAG: hypothetical protein JSV78_04810 [Phycisphaerales bacterium]